MRIGALEFPRPVQSASSKIIDPDSITDVSGDFDQNPRTLVLLPSRALCSEHNSDSLGAFQSTQSATRPFGVALGELFDDASQLLVRDAGQNEVRTLSSNRQTFQIATIANLYLHIAVGDKCCGPAATPGSARKTTSIKSLYFITDPPASALSAFKSTVANAL